jgi:hypothetical protein
LIYLNEFRTGAVLKDSVRKCAEKKKFLEDKLRRLESELDAAKDLSEQDAGKIAGLELEIEKTIFECDFIRIDVTEENLAKLSDGPLAGKLTYESRDECSTREFDLSIYEDPVDGKHYPLIDGEPYRWFTIESIYERWRLLAQYFLRIRDEAIRRLKEKGVERPPDDSDFQTFGKYWDLVGTEMRSLPKEFLPPAEYEFVYSDAKIEACFKTGAVLKTRYNLWKKRGSKDFRIGAWQCEFCNWRGKCLPMEYPDLAYMALQGAETTEEVV